MENIVYGSQNFGLSKFHRGFLKSASRNGTNSQKKKSDIMCLIGLDKPLIHFPYVS